MRDDQNRRGSSIGATLRVVLGAALLSMLFLAAPAGAQTTTTEAETTTTEADDTTTTTEAETTTTTADDDTDDGDAPAGGADTGAGGTSGDDPLVPLGVALVGGALVIGAAGLATRAALTRS